MWVMQGYWFNLEIHTYSKYHRNIQKNRDIWDMQTHRTFSSHLAFLLFLGIAIQQNGAKRYLFNVLETGQEKAGKMAEGNWETHWGQKGISFLGDIGNAPQKRRLRFLKPPEAMTISGVLHLPWKYLWGHLSYILHSFPMFRTGWQINYGRPSYDNNTWHPHFK